MPAALTLPLKHVLGGIGVLPPPYLGVGCVLPTYAVFYPGKLKIIGAESFFFIYRAYSECLSKLCEACFRQRFSSCCPEPSTSDRQSALSGSSDTLFETTHYRT